MNLKERIEIIDKIKNVSSLSDIEIKRELDAVDIFVKNATVEKIIKNAVNEDENIILFCPSYLDKTLAANYIRSFLNENISFEILSDISDNLPFVSAQKVIVPEPLAAEIIKIFELILCDFKTFIFAMNLKSFENALESLRTFIALNCPNLSSNNVEHLIGMSGAVLIYVDRTEDGLFTVSNIGKIIYRKDAAFLDILYSSDEIVKDDIEQEPQTIKAPVIFEPAVIENVVCDEVKPIEECVAEETEQEVFEENSEIIDENEQFEEVPEQIEESELVEEHFEAVEVNDEAPSFVIEESEVLEEHFETVETNDEAPSCVIEEKEVPKVNKYKLLKEKIKSKKA